MGGRSVLDAYRKQLVGAGRSIGTISQRVGDVERFARTIGDLRRVTEDDVTAYFAAHPRWMPEYRKNVSTSLRQFFDWAFRHGHLVADPSNAVPHVQVSPQARPPAPEDLLEEALATAGPQLRAMLLLGATLGMRRTEIATAHPRNRHGRVLTVVGKNDKGRRIPLDSATFAILTYLEREQGPDEYYFPGRSGDGHLHPCTVYKWIRAALGNGWSTHSLRRRAGYIGFHRTHDIRAVQTLLGHNSMDTTSLYVYSDEAAVAHVTEATSFVDRLSPPDVTDNVPDGLAAILADIVSVTKRAADAGLNVTLNVE